MSIAPRSRVDTPTGSGLVATRTEYQSLVLSDGKPSVALVDNDQLAPEMASPGGTSKRSKTPVQHAI
jgi:hypothetical protein